MMRQALLLLMITPALDGLCCRCGGDSWPQHSLSDTCSALIHSTNYSLTSSTISDSAFTNLPVPSLMSKV